MINEKQSINYLGWRDWYPTDEELANLFSNPDYLPEITKDMVNNEYLLVHTKDTNGEDLITGQYCFEGGHLRKFGHGSLSWKLSDLSEEPNKKSKTTKKTLCPRNAQQVLAFDLMNDETKTIKLLTGTWGTGKTLLLVGAALEGLTTGRFERIIWVRNNVKVAGTPDLGAMPGDKNEKLRGYLGPFIDHVGEYQVDKMIEKQQLVVQPLQDIRGRNFENSIIICSEAENLTKEHIQLIIARAAEGSIILLDADCRQRDHSMFEKSRGIEILIDRLKGQELFGYVHLIKSERSATARLADLLND